MRSRSIWKGELVLIDVLIAALLLIGCAFLLLAAVGIVRMPDIFTRMSASSKATTLGIGCMLVALALHFGDPGVTTKVLLVIAFFFLKAPVAAHVLARAAYRVGTPLWKGTFVDELREYYDSEDYLVRPMSEDTTPGADQVNDATNRGDEPTGG